MPAFLAGIIVLGLLLVLARSYTRAGPGQLAKGFRLSGGVALGLVTVALAMTGRLALAMLAGGGAWALLFGTVPPWLRMPSSTGYGNGGQSGRSGTNSAPPQSSAMSRAEAFKVLGLEQGANEQDIRAAHRRLIQQTHPDKGGTSYLAAKINEAKDVLLGRRR